MNCRCSFTGNALLLFGILGFTHGKIHSLTVSNDERSMIILSDFSFMKGGYLKVNITNLKISQPHQPKIGFSFDKSSSPGISSYIERQDSDRGCVLDYVDYDSPSTGQFDDMPRAIMNIASVPNNIGQFQLEIGARLLHGLKFYASEDELKKVALSTESKDVASKSAGTTNPTTKSTAAEDCNKPEIKDEALVIVQKATTVDKTSKPKAPPSDEVKSTETPSRQERAVVEKKVDTKDEDTEFVMQDPLPIHGDLNEMNIVFYTQIESDDQKGLYELYFHNCENSKLYSGNLNKEVVTVDFIAQIVEKNGESYLLSDDIVLPLMYGVMCLMFFCGGVVWVHLICTTRKKVVKIHYLMAVVIFLKGLSVMFHSLDYYFIAKDGKSGAWAVTFYIVHMLKGILLFTCLVLIGTGWSFVKYILSNRDKTILTVVISLQVIANVAYIMMAEMEEGNRSYGTWKDVAVLVDLLCCGAVLIPVAWSMRHLDGAPQTNDKAVKNLTKHRLFRHFCIMVICYLYVARIITYLLIISLPFEYSWIPSVAQELMSFVFFAATGYKFRPGCDNSYLKLDQDDSDDEAEAIALAGMTEKKLSVDQ